MNARKLLLGLSSALLVLVLVGPALAGTLGTAKYDIHVSELPGVGLRPPALDRDNTLYVGADNGRVYAINTDGTIKWNYNAGSPVTTNAAVYYSPDGQNAQYDGTIYVGLENGDVLALDPSGNQEWRFHAGSPINAAPALAADGTIYVGKEPSVLVAITPDGDLKWSREIIGSTQGIYDPVVGPDGTIYFGARDDDHFFAYSPNGTLKWAEPSCYAWGPAAIGKDGTIYFVSEYALNALRPSGDKRWSRNVSQFGETLEAAPVIGHEDVIYVGADALLAINRDSTWEWVFWGGPGGPPVPAASAAVDNTGLIYFPAEDGNIYSVTPVGTFVWSYYAAVPHTWMSASVIGSDGLLHSTDTNRIRALYTGAPAPFNGPWPMYRHDAQCTARLDTPWTIADALAELMVFVLDSDIDGRIKRQLVMRLDLTKRSLDMGLLLPAIHQLGAFINYVEAQEGKKIPEELADVLIRDALEILMLADGTHPRHGPRPCTCAWGRKAPRLAPCRRHRPMQVASPHRQDCGASKKR
jgi:outer membrane protein assembly factor BamB